MQPALTSFCPLMKSHPGGENRLEPGLAKVRPPAALETPAEKGLPTGSAAGMQAEGFSLHVSPPTSQFL